MPQPETTPTTRLQAVNTLLRAIGESPVSSLFSEGGLDVPTAIATLDEISRAVQAEGWMFNTEYEYPLLRKSDGTISAPLAALAVDFLKHGNGGADPVIRGRRIYDRKNHTYTFSQNLKATIVMALDFEEMPEAARYYVTVRACRKMVDTEIGSNALHTFTQNDEIRARAKLESQQLEFEDNNMLNDTPNFWRVRKGGNGWR